MEHTSVEVNCGLHILLALIGGKISHGTPWTSVFAPHKSLSSADDLKTSQSEHVIHQPLPPFGYLKSIIIIKRMEYLWIF